MDSAQRTSPEIETTPNPGGESAPESGVGKGFVVLFVGVLAGCALVAYLLATSPIDPAPYEPPPAPELTGSWAVNNSLESAEILGAGEIPGPEDVEVDAEGRIYGAAVDGRILRIDAEGAIETVVDTGGRPLGLAWDPQGRLLIADAANGLLRADVETRELETLATEAGGKPFAFTDDLDVGADGAIYFSDASWLHDHHHYKHDLLEARPRGRLLRHVPASEDAPATTEVLQDGLYFANGVALAPDESFVLVNETYRYRITRYWLKGPKQGEAEIFIDNLPGFPDGVSTSPRGTFWVALFTVRNRVADLIHPYPNLKRIVASLPEWTQPQAQPYGFIVELDLDGEVLRTLQDPTGEIVPQATSAEEVDGFLYLGNLDRDGVRRLRLP